MLKNREKTQQSATKQTLKKPERQYQSAKRHFVLVFNIKIKITLDKQKKRVYM